MVRDSIIAHLKAIMQMHHPAEEPLKEGDLVYLAKIPASGTEHRVWKLMPTFIGSYLIALVVWYRPIL